jgi:hypothetical protein
LAHFAEIRNHFGQHPGFPVAQLKGLRHQQPLGGCLGAGRAGAELLIQHAFVGRVLVDQDQPLLRFTHNVSVVKLTDDAHVSKRLLLPELGLRGSRCELRVSGYGLWVAGFGVRVSRCVVRGIWLKGGRSEVQFFFSEFRIPNSEFSWKCF